MAILRWQGGEVLEGRETSWSQRPHQKWVHLVFLSARPQSYKGLTVRKSLLVLSQHKYCT